MNDTIEMIQLLVDGELSHDERQRLIAYLDNERPEAWRDVALGFIENQMVAEAFQPAEAVSPRPSVVPFHSQLRGLAAALILGLGLGWFVSSIDLQTNAPQLAAVENQLESKGTESSEIPAQDDQYDSQKALLAMSASNEMMKQIDQAYVEQGIYPTHQKGYIIASLSNGSDLLIPLNYMAISQR